MIFCPPVSFLSTSRIRFYSCTVGYYTPSQVHTDHGVHCPTVQLVGTAAVRITCACTACTLYSPRHAQGLASKQTRTRDAAGYLFVRPERHPARRRGHPASTGHARPSDSPSSFNTPHGATHPARGSRRQTTSTRACHPASANVCYSCCGCSAAMPALSQRSSSPRPHAAHHARASCHRDPATFATAALSVAR